MLPVFSIWLEFCQYLLRLRGLKSNCDNFDNLNEYIKNNSLRNIAFLTE
jgi:hypothetical protein